MTLTAPHPVPPAGDEAAADPAEGTDGLLLPRWALVAGLVAVVVAGEVSVAAGAYLSFLSPLVGFLACFGVPLVLVHQMLGGRRLDGPERIVLAVALALLVLMVSGLVINFALPVFGVARPLDTWPVLVTSDVVDAGLLAAVYGRMPAGYRLATGLVTGWRSQTVFWAAAVTVPLAVMGAVRINNGAGSGMSLVGLALVLVTFAVLVKWWDLTDTAVTSAAIYFVSLALLYMTSLRGWYTTGHDIQNEMLAFLDTAQRGRWTNSVHNGYNSCLSITILPTEILRWTRVSNPYVYKVFFQALYAFCPVAVYRVARRITSEALSLVATFFFIGFVSFMQDMPMLNRQEIGFVFFAASLLALFMTEQPRRWRWTLFCLLSTGMVLSHYSTSYFAAAALFVALAARSLSTGLLGRMFAPWRRLEGVRPGEPILAWRLFAFVLVLAVIWNGPLNDDGGALISKVSSAISSAVGHGQQTRAAEASYSVAGPGRGVTKADAYNDLLATEAKVRAEHPGAFISSPPPSASLTPLAPAQLLPLTSLGRAVLGSEAAAYAFNRDWRTLAAWGLQVLLAIGLLAVVFWRRYASVVTGDAVYLGLAMVVLLMVQVVLPGISLDYGVGRSFMQALMVLGPFMAIGGAALCGLVAAKWRNGVAFGMAGAIFASTSGLVPQLLGGYGPQLNLNNAGDYYDRYLIQPQTVAGIGWLRSSVIDTSSRYPDIQTDFDTLNQARSLGTLRAFDDLYPSDIHKDAYVVLAYPPTVEGRDLEIVDGYELWIEYPTGVLAGQKSLVYSNGEMEIYR